MEQNEQVCLQIRDLSKQFTIYNNGKTIYACQHVNLTLNQGEFIGITGKSGSGKSTILKGIYRTNLPQAGEIWYASEKYGWIDLCQATERQILYLRRYEIGYVSQFLQLMPRTTARQIVENAILEMGETQKQHAGNQKRSCGILNWTKVCGTLTLTPFQEGKNCG